MTNQDDEAHVNSEVEHAKRFAREKIVELLESPYFTHNLFEIELDTNQKFADFNRKTRKTDSSVGGLTLLLRCMNVLRDDLLDWASNNYDERIEAAQKMAEAMTKEVEAMTQEVEALRGKEQT